MSMRPREEEGLSTGKADLEKNSVGAGAVPCCMKKSERMPLVDLNDLTYAARRAGWRRPQMLPCPECKKTKLSTVRFVYGKGSLLLSLVLCFTTCGILALIPCCCQRCQDAQHLCGWCGSPIYVVKPR